MTFDEDSMPVMCDCGEWFDLLDGYASRKGYPSESYNTVCRKCHEIDVMHEKRIEELYAIGDWLDDGSISFNEARRLVKQQGITTVFKTKQALISWAMNYRYEE